MNQNRTLKTEEVTDLGGIFSGHSFHVVVQPSGLTVAQSSDLRRQIGKAEGGLRVAKNTLVRLALKGTKYEGLTAHMKGPTAIAYAKEPVAISKVLTEFAKKNPKLKVIGANLDGQMLDAKAVDTLAKLPSLNELRARLVGMIQTPATRIAGILQAPAGQVARVIGAYARKS